VPQSRSASAAASSLATTIPQSRTRSATCVPGLAAATRFPPAHRVVNFDGELDAHLMPRYGRTRISARSRRLLTPSRLNAYTGQPTSKTLKACPVMARNMGKIKNEEYSTIRGGPVKPEQLDKWNNSGQGNEHRVHPDDAGTRIHDNGHARARAPGADLVSISTETPSGWVRRKEAIEHFMQGRHSTPLSLQPNNAAIPGQLQQNGNRASADHNRCRHGIAFIGRP
jgi:hypothetical protein